MKRRRKTGRPRGRPRHDVAKRRQTTRVGRKTGRDPVDYGTLELRERKKTATGRMDLPLDPAAVLYGRDLLDRQQYDRIGEIGHLMRQLARAWGIKQDSVDGLWTALLAAASRTASPRDITPAGAENARRRLDRALRRLDGSKGLVLQLAEHRTVPIVVRAWSRSLTPRDAVVLERLRRALDRLPG